MNSTVLLVDDEPDILDSLAAYIGHWIPGVEIATASGAGEALELLQARPVDLVVSDLRMPGRDGLELLDEVGARSPATCRMLITAYPEADLEERAAAIGVTRVLRKPFDLREFVQVVREALREAGGPPSRGAAAAASP